MEASSCALDTLTHSGCQKNNYIRIDEHAVELRNEEGKCTNTDGNSFGLR
jgi:hypothetical protein